MVASVFGRPYHTTSLPIADYRDKKTLNPDSIRKFVKFKKNSSNVTDLTNLRELSPGH